MPVVSVVMPIYKRPEFVPMAIESILNQTFGDFELICVDGRDGGEECRDIVQSYATKDSRVKYMIQNGVGASDARNTGLNHASGEYFAAHDSDDMSNSQRLRKQLDFLKNNSGYAAVGGQTVRINEVGKVVSRVRVKSDRIQSAAKGDLLCYRRAALSAGGYRSFFIVADDSDFAARFAEKGFVTGIMEADSYFRRVHSSYRLSTDYAVALKYLLVTCYCAYCRKTFGRDPVDEGKNLEQILKQLGGIHLPLKDFFDDSMVLPGLRLSSENTSQSNQSLSCYFIKICQTWAKKSMESGNYSDFHSIIQFLESYLGVDEISKRDVWRTKIQLSWKALLSGYYLKCFGKVK